MVPVWLVRHCLFIYLWKICVFFLQVFVTPPSPHIVLPSCMKCAVQIKFYFICFYSYVVYALVDLRDRISVKVTLCNNLRLFEVWLYRQLVLVPSSWSCEGQINTCEIGR